MSVLTRGCGNTTCATLMPPLQLAGQGTTPSSVQLTWEDYTYNEDGFTIEVSPDGSTWSSLATVAANSTSHIDSGLSESTSYYYRVRVPTRSRSGPGMSMMQQYLLLPPIASAHEPWGLHRLTGLSPIGVAAPSDSRPI
jgi:hypothetical protein